jgi:hypothetical protein
MFLVIETTREKKSEEVDVEKCHPGSLARTDRVSPGTDI